MCAGQATRIYKGSVAVGDRTISGDDLGVLTIGTFGLGSERGRLVYALIGGSGITGMRATERIPYLLSGVGIPDLCVLHSDLWTKGSSAIECAGFLDQDFGAARAEIAWRPVDSGSPAGAGATEPTK